MLLKSDPFKLLNKSNVWANVSRNYLLFRTGMRPVSIQDNRKFPADDETVLDETRNRKSGTLGFFKGVRSWGGG
jgi:hypothetical protein